MKKYFFFGFLWVGMIACKTDGIPMSSTMPLSVKVISSSLHCRPASKNWTVTLIDSQAMHELMASKIDAHLVESFSEKVSPVDFDDFYVIAIEMGRQPTAGFGIDPKKVSASLEDRAAILRISWYRPSPDSQVAQMLTSPCLLVLLARGAYDRIIVEDQENKTLGKLTAERK